MNKNNILGILPTVKKVVTYAKPHKLYFFLSIFFAFGAIGINMSIPVVVGLAVDCVVGPGNVDFAQLAKILLLIGSLAVISAIFEWFEVLFENILTNRTAQSMRNKCF